ncbi:MAG: N-acetylmuramoyl-L-alanine amidase [Deltaproteobacteria bacterium]|nr:N-acetylmuramoyl-L-alanine amidase [Deltaproteobacteria bacterium]
MRQLKELLLQQCLRDREDKTSLKPLPPSTCRRIIEEFAVLVPDPVQKLRFLNRVLERYRKTLSIYKLSPPFQETVVRKLAMDEIERLCPGARKKVRKLMRQGTISAPRPTPWNIYKYRHSIITIVMAALVLGLGTGVASFRNIISPTPSVTQESGDEHAEEIYGLVESPDEQYGEAPDEGNTKVANVSPLPGGKETAYAPESTDNSFPEYIEEPIWLVEESSDRELHSNGLRIITTFTVENEPRIYYRFPRDSDRLPTEADLSSKIVGILYHASESDIIDFIPEKNQSLKKYSKALLKYVCRNKFYHYFINRFGQVFRVVREDHAAFHAGNSVWADDENIYLNLNHAFIGVCFEGKAFEEVKSQPGGPKLTAMKTSTINEAQLISGKELTDWLRVKYHICQGNCVTHGLVSINPEAKLIGYHVDLAHGFPYRRFGLKDKSRCLLPTITEFGFSHDSYFLKVFKGHVWPGIGYSEEHLRSRAGIANIPLAEYRMQLNRRFTRWFEWQKKQKEDQSKDHDQICAMAD